MNRPPLSWTTAVSETKSTADSKVKRRGRPGKGWGSASARRGRAAARRPGPGPRPRGGPAASRRGYGRRGPARQAPHDEEGHEERPAATRTGTTTARTKRTTAARSSRRLSRGLASPPVRAVEPARSSDFAAWGTSADGAPTATPRAMAVRGSEICHITDAARSAPTAGRRTVDSASRAWSTAGNLSPTISTSVATPKRTRARLEAMNWNDAPSSMKPPRASAPARSKGSQARSPAQAARPMPRATEGTSSVQAADSMTAAWGRRG